jgi:LytS/YehU family sensor histidine kinase
MWTFMLQKVKPQLLVLIMVAGLLGLGSIYAAIKLNEPSIATGGIGMVVGGLIGLGKGIIDKDSNVPEKE